MFFLLFRTELTKNVVLPELVELARDEGSSVRLAAFETLVNLLEMFDAGKLIDRPAAHSFAVVFLDYRIEFYCMNEVTTVLLHLYGLSTLLRFFYYIFFIFFIFDCYVPHETSCTSSSKWE